MNNQVQNKLNVNKYINKDNNNNARKINNLHANRKTILKGELTS